MAKNQPTSKAVVKKTGIVPKRPCLSLIAQATDKYPQANPDPRGHLSMIAADLRERADQLEYIYQLSGMDEQNPVVIGMTYFTNLIRDAIRKNSDLLENIVKTLHEQEGDSNHQPGPKGLLHKRMPGSPLPVWGFRAVRAMNSYLVLIGLGSELDR